MNFGFALTLLKNGKRVTRKGWNGKNMWVVKITLRMNDDSLSFIENDCLVLKNVNGGFNTWIPSITDLFAEDWEEVTK